jgi:hypothetical protein
MRNRIMRAEFDVPVASASDLLGLRISLAAMPVFVAMALATGLGGGEMADMPGMATSPLNGMALMYLLMAVFHAAPWLKLISKRRMPQIHGAQCKETES